MPISPPALTNGAGRTLDMLNNIFAKSSGRPDSSFGYSILTECREETWQLKKSASPSLVRRDRISRATELGSPSDDSPSVRWRTVGGNPSLCSDNHWSSNWRADEKAWHIGVPPFETGSIQTGKRTCVSTSPPAPSGTFLFGSPTARAAQRLLK